MFAIKHSDDLAAVSGSTLDILTTIVNGFKFATTFLRIDEIMEIVRELQAIFNERGIRNREYNVKKHLDYYYFFIRIFAVTLMVITLPVAFPIFPFLMSGTMEMSMKFWFPFDPLTPVNFPFVTLWTDFVVWNAMVFVLASDSLLYALITVLAMEFDIEKTDLMNFSSTPNDEKANRVKYLTDRHNQLLDLSDKLQNIYSISLFVSFALSAVIMCIIAFRLTIADSDIFVYSFFIPYMGLMGGEILLLCNFGQSRWELSTDNNLKKCFILIIQRAKRAKTLTALGFADISINTFTTVGSYMTSCTHLTELIHFRLRQRRAPTIHY